MRVAVTGAAGLVGRSAVRALRSQGDEVLALVRPGRESCGLAVPVLGVDVEDQGGLERALAGMDAVIHAAALLAGHDDAVRRVNVDGTRNLLAAMRGAMVGRIVLLSTVAVYGDGDFVDVDEDQPLSPRGAYAESKATCEAMVRTACVDGVTTGFVLRPTTIYGAEDQRGVTPFLLSLAREGVIPLVRGGTVRMDLVAAADVGRACALAVRATEGRGEALHVSSDEHLDMRNLVERLRGIGLPARALDIDPSNPPVGMPRELIALVSEHRSFSNARARIRIGYRSASRFPDELTLSTPVR